MRVKILISYTFVLLLLSSCIANNGRIVVNMAKTNQPKNIIVSNIKIVNHQVVITGENLNTVKNLALKEGSSTVNLQIESQNSNSLVANSLSNITFVASKIFDFVLTNASASATFTINFSLCDSLLGGKEIDCIVTPNDKEVLSYDGGSGKWKPRSVNGLSYKGVWDASDPAPAAVTPGDYYIVSAPGSGYNVGDWTVYRGAGNFDRVNNSTTITSVFGRTNAVVGVKGDYNLGDLGDVDLTSTPASPDDVLTFVGGQWVPRAVVSAGQPSVSVTSADIVDGTIVNADINATAAIAYSKLNVPALAIPLTALNATGTKDGTKYLKGDNTWAVLQTDIQALVLSTYTLGTNAVVTASDSVTSAVGKLQKQISDLAVSAVGGDVSGNLPTLTVTKIQGTSISATTPTSGNFFKYNGTNWLGSMVTANDLKSSALGNLFPSLGCAANQTLYYSVIGDAFTCTDIGTLDGAKITTGTIASARLPASANYWQPGSRGAIIYENDVLIKSLHMTGDKISLKNDSGGTAQFNSYAYDGGNVDYIAYTSEGTSSAPTKISSANYLLARLIAYGRSDTFDSPAASIEIISDGVFSDTSAPGNILFKTNAVGFSALPTEKMRITSGGNVGIGRINPAAKLDVAGPVLFGDGVSASQSVTILGANSATNILDIGANGAGLELRNTDATNNNFTHIAFRSSTGFPSAKIIGVNTNHTSVDGDLSFATTTSGVLSEKMRILSNGNIGIGVAAPNEKLEVAGNIKIVSAATCILGGGSGATNCTSDRRLKENVSPIKNAIDKIKQLSGVEFDWNERSHSPGVHAVGVIAQDVEKIFPTFVITDKATGYKMVDYAALVAPLIQATKEQQQQIENNLAMFKLMQGDLQEMKRAIASANKRIEKIEAENIAKDKEIAKLQARLSRIEKMLLD